MPIPIDVRRKPASVKVHVSSGKGVDIVWSDDHASHYDFGYLRDECPCALCNDERQKKREAKFAGAPAANSSLLPMYKPKLAAKAAHAIGNYALQIDFNDGHTAGIFSFDYLRFICPCEACVHERQKNADSDSR